MPVKLSPEVKEKVFNRIREAFSDFASFDIVAAELLKKVINDADFIEIDKKTAKHVTKRYAPIKRRKKGQDDNVEQAKLQKILVDQIHLILRTNYVLILSYHPPVEALMENTVEGLLRDYPQFLEEKDTKELEYLSNFRCYLIVALQLFPARLNKQLLINIAARLEGSGNEYITGGGQRLCVTRRVQMYEKEGNITKQTRIYQSQRAKQAFVQQNNLTKKRKLAPSMMQVREIKKSIVSEDALDSIITINMQTLNKANHDGEGVSESKEYDENGDYEEEYENDEVDSEEEESNSDEEEEESFPMDAVDEKEGAGSATALTASGGAAGGSGGANGIWLLSYAAEQLLNN